LTGDSNPRQDSNGSKKQYEAETKCQKRSDECSTTKNKTMPGADRRSPKAER
jgi:hypothetical protein